MSLWYFVLYFYILNVDLLVLNGIKTPKPLGNDFVKLTKAKMEEKTEIVKKTDLKFNNNIADMLTLIDLIH